MKKKLTPEKKAYYLKRVDTIKGKIQELAWKMQADGIERGTVLQSAGRAVEEINKLIERS